MKNLKYGPSTQNRLSLSWAVTSQPGPEGVTRMSFSSRHTLAVLFTVLSLAASVCAQTTTKESAKVPRGSISGRVTFKDRGVPGVAIGLRKGGDGFSPFEGFQRAATDRKSTRLNSSHGYISYAVFCLK